MPIYEYKCPNGHLFEVIHSMADSGPGVCQVCEEGPIERVLHPVAVHFKGSGFYATDYGRGTRKIPPKDGGSSGEGRGDSSGGGSEAKSEPKKAAEA
jgi:putative FmdB family regulatory protein